MKAIPTDLVGRFFMSRDSADGFIEWQGTVVGSPEPGWYLVSTFEWFMGLPSTMHLVRIEDMAHWLFYEDQEHMVNDYENGVAYNWRRDVHDKREEERKKPFEFVSAEELCKIPDAPAKVVEGPGHWLLIVPKCPYCGKKHVHGGGALTDEPGFGHRVDHCRSGGPGYNLVPEDTGEKQP